MNLNSASDGTLNVGMQVLGTDPAVNADEGFISHAAGVGEGGVSLATLNLNGEADYTLNLGQSIGTINQGANVNLADLRFTIADQDFTSIGSGAGSAHVTVLNGFSGDHTEVTFNGITPAAANFADIGNQGGTVQQLATALDTALDATHQYVFAVYTGTGDINGDGTADTNVGVLAMDGDGTGITTVLMLPGVTSMTANDIHTVT
jgi:hypothetical protein